MKKFMKSFFSLALVCLFTAGIFAGCGAKAQSVDAADCLTRLETLSTNLTTQNSPDNYSFTTTVLTKDGDKTTKQEVFTQKSGTLQNFTIHTLMKETSSDPAALPVVTDDVFLTKINESWTLINKKTETYSVVDGTRFDESLAYIDSYKSGIAATLDMFMPVLKEKIATEKTLFNATVLDGIYTLKFDYSVDVDGAKINSGIEIKFSETNFYKVSFITGLTSGSRTESMSIVIDVVYATQNVVLPDITNYTAEK